MIDMAAAPANDGSTAPASCRSHRYWRELLELHDGERDREPCWRNTEIDVCLEKSDSDTGLCRSHINELKDW